MYNPGPVWKRYQTTRQLTLFLKQYTDTLLFKLTAPGSSIFWISSSIFGNIFKTTSDVGGTEITVTLGDVLSLIALFVLIFPAIYFWYNFKPFNVIIEWDHLSQRDIDVRAKRRGRLVLDDDEALVRIKVFFDESVNRYALELDPDRPLNIRPTDEPPNADYEDGILRAENVNNPKFYFVLKITAEDDLYAYEPEIKIRDFNNNRKLLLRIGVT